jgi:ribosomal protein L1
MYKLEYLKKADWPEESIEEAVKVVKEEFSRSYAEMDIREQPVDVATRSEKVQTRISLPHMH